MITQLFGKLRMEKTVKLIGFIVFTLISVYFSDRLVFSSSFSEYSFTSRFLEDPIWFVSLTFFFTFCFGLIVKLIQESIIPYDLAVLEEVNPDKNRLQLIKSLKDRANTFRVASRATLVLIVSTLIIGLIIFVNAGQIAVSQSLDRKEFEDRMNILGERISKVKSDLNFATDSEIRRGLLDELKTLNNSQAKLIEGTGNNKGDSDISVFASSLTTRIGSILVLLFLVQILVTLYKYSLRISSFYDARADIIQMAPASYSFDLKALLEIFSPDSLDFGKTPSSPTDQAISLTKEILGKVKN